MEVIKWIFVVAALAGMALALVELATEKPDAATDSDRLPDGLAGTWERRTPDGRMEATIADGARGRPGVRGLAGGLLEGRLRGEGPEMGGPRGSGGLGGVPYMGRRHDADHPQLHAVRTSRAWDA